MTLKCFAFKKYACSANKFINGNAREKIKDNINILIALGLWNIGMTIYPLYKAKLLTLYVLKKVD